MCTFFKVFPHIASAQLPPNFRSRVLPPGYVASAPRPSIITSTRVFPPLVTIPVVPSEPLTAQQEMDLAMSMALTGALNVADRPENVEESARLEVLHMDPAVRPVDNI